MTSRSMHHHAARPSSVLWPLPDNSPAASFIARFTLPPTRLNDFTTFLSPYHRMNRQSHRPHISPIRIHHQCIRKVRGGSQVETCQSNSKSSDELHCYS